MLCKFGSVFALIYIVNSVPSDLVAKRLILLPEVKYICCILHVTKTHVMLFATVINYLSYKVDFC